MTKQQLTITYPDNTTHTYTSGAKRIKTHAIAVHTSPELAQAQYDESVAEYADLLARDCRTQAEFDEHMVYATECREVLAGKWLTRSEHYSLESALKAMNSTYRRPGQTFQIVEIAATPA